MTSLAAFVLLSLAAQDKRVVLVAGPLDSHPTGTHEYEKNVLLLKHALDHSNVKGLTVEVHLGWPSDPATIEKADAIFLTSGGSDHRLEDHPLHVGGRFASVERAMKRGAGLVLHHWSTFHPAARHEAITEWVGGYFDYETGPGPRKWYSSIETREWTTAVGAPAHPVARGVTPFRLKEEFYFRMRFRDPDPRLATVLLRQEGGDARADAVAWAVERAGGGRGFGFTGGHYFANWWIPGFRRLVLNALVWSAGLDVPAGGVESALADPARVLIVTGHQHPAHDWRATTTALLRVLERDPRIVVEVVEDPEELGRRDLARYAAIAMNYNNWQRGGLSEGSRAAFSKRLSDGGGCSILHFANGAFGDWDEYRTKIVRRAWVEPGSGHDPFGPFRVTPTAVDHPITKGLAPFDTEDELYFKQAGPLPIEPLATARSKVTGLDEPMAWAHEFGKGRVFQTVLGHSELSIRRAAALIRRGTAWAAGLPPLGFDPSVDGLEKPALRRGQK